MKIRRCLFYPLSIVIGIFLPSLCCSQSNVTDIKDSTGLHSYLVFRGDTLFIGYDSAYVLNKITFRLFNENYLRIQKGDPAVKKLFGEYEHVIAYQDSMLRAKETYYQDLKKNYQTLSETTRNFIDVTNPRIQNIDTSLSNASGHIQKIDALLSDALKELKKQNKQKLKLAAGGFSIGFVAASIILLIVK